MSKQSNYKDVADFHEKFGVPVAKSPTLLTGEALKYRIDFLQEELDEFVQAHETGDLEGAVDAMLDLVYVAMGTADFMGVGEERWQRCWDEVQRANMSKERAQTASESKRGTSLDVVKPEGWYGPQLKPILGIE